MTVAELIECLRALPQDLPVYPGDWNELYAHDSALDTESDGPRVMPAYRESSRGVGEIERPERVTIGSSCRDWDDRKRSPY